MLSYNFCNGNANPECPLRYCPEAVKHVCHHFQPFGSPPFWWRGEFRLGGLPSRPLLAHVISLRATPDLTPPSFPPVGLRSFTDSPLTGEASGVISNKGLATLKMRWIFRTIEWRIQRENPRISFHFHVKNLFPTHAANPETFLLNAMLYTRI